MFIATIALYCDFFISKCTQLHLVFAIVKLLTFVTL